MNVHPPPPITQPIADLAAARRTLILAGLSSMVLAAIKITTGIVGNSYALVADGIESLTDVAASAAVLVGLTYSLKPPDKEHPYGHGKAETFSMLFVAMALIAAALLIGVESLHEIMVPHSLPAWFTLPVLIGVIITKLVVSRMVGAVGTKQGSTAMEADAWHHLSDAITSAAALVGISIALIGGQAYAAADDWAALAACTIIFYNGLRLGLAGTQELLEAQAPHDFEEQLRAVAGRVDGVKCVEKLRVRKSGLGYLMDVHIHVDGDLTVSVGHDIAGAVKSALVSAGLRVTDVTVHIEPCDPALLNTPATSSSPGLVSPPR